MKCIVTCIRCGEVKKAKNTSGIYCSNQCQQLDAWDKQFERWINGEDVFKSAKSVKSAFIRLSGYRCRDCGVSSWNNKILVLELEHQNGDSTDNRPENLALLCPNCHSQTSTFKYRNKGNGRHARRIRYASGKSY